MRHTQNGDNPGPEGRCGNAASELTAQLLALTLRALRREFQDANLSLFGGKLRGPTLALSRGKSRLGQWTEATRTLEISQDLVLRQSWGAVVEVLKHEMAHQYVAEILGVRDEPAHGPAFVKVCLDRGIDARAAGTPVPEDEEKPGIIQKVAKLLSLAASENQNEAEAAMNAAQRLMLRFNIDQSALRSDANDFCFRQLGKPSGRVFEPARLLALLLSEHFFVEGIWVPVWRPLEGKSGSVFEICGTRANVEMAAYAYDFLVRTAERLWREHKRKQGIQRDRDRRSFLAGVMSGFRAKLASQQRRNEAEGLVWCRDEALVSYFRQRHPRAGWVRYTARHDAGAHAAGHQAGQKIVLHRGVTSSTHGPARLLPRG